VSATCGCCAGLHVETPLTVFNRAGLSAIAYRAGDWASFRHSMRASLTGSTAIAKLTTREDDDFTIALLDAWAVSSDVLTFYQERIANESYLRTAGERFSVLELARLIGYELAPGVAAGVWLAFTVDATPGAPQRVTVAAGSRAQSVPGQDEQPQTFETSSALDARAEWNELRAQTAIARNPLQNDTGIHFDGTDTKIVFGDGLLFLGPGFAEFHRVLTVTPDSELKKTRVTWSGALGGNATTVQVMRERANLFGHNAPLKITSVDPLKTVEWTFAVTSPLLLDGVHDRIQPNTSLVITAPGQTAEIVTVKSVEEVPHADFSISGKTTEVTLESPPSLKRFDTRYRTVTVFGAPETLPLAGYPVEDKWLPANDIVLATKIPPFEKGRPIIVTGLVNGEPDSELAFVASVKNGGTTLNLVKGLTKTFERASVRIRANVAHATHGESVREVLGSGDAAVPFQRFRLSHAPLTYLLAPGGTGETESTLSVFVNDVRWHEVPSLYAQGPHARVYATRRNDDGFTYVQFGDGKSTGARLPTGTNNVRAVYRKTMGTSGNVDAKKITLLLSRPLGLGEVTNPMPAAGGDDAQKLSDARTNAPHTVRTLDRVVSLRDYQSFAESFPLIAKAVATWTWQGNERQVFLTVAGRNGIEFLPNDATLLALTRALRLHGHPYVPLRVVSYQKVPFVLQAAIGVEKDHIAEVVLPSVRAAVAKAFAFDSRSFGEAVDLSDIVKVIHAVDGVVWVDVDELRRTSEPIPKRNERLTARLPRQDNNGTLIPAEILVLDAAVIVEAQ
jgi:hypothetical protein